VSDSADGQVTSLPSWSEVDADYVSTGIPVIFVIRSSPAITMFVDSGGAKLGARFADVSGAALKLPTLEAIQINIIKIDENQFIEVSTTSNDLFRKFYYILSDLVLDVVAKNADIRTVLAAIISSWSSLLRPSSILSDEREIGLTGELWLLDRLIAIHGPDVISAWVGPRREVHDFRLGSVEFEVKATSRPRRIHTINGLTQLVASEGCALFIASVRLVDSGSGGKTLPEMVQAIREDLSSSKDASSSFEICLSSVGYFDSDAASYSRRRRLGDSVHLVPVDPGVPRLTPVALSFLPQDYASERIIKVSYDIDITGLGFADGSAEFLQIIPSRPSEAPEHLQ
jgi:hypothetical protein